MERASQMLIMCRSCGRQNRITRAPMGLRPVCGTRGCGATLPACVICGQPCESGGMLTNGGTYHGQCHQRVLNEIEALRSQLATIRSEHSAVKKRADSERSWTARITRLFKGPTPRDPDLAHRQVALEKTISGVERTLAESNLLLSRIYTYWLTYPPDWDDRRLEFLRNNPFCDMCHSRRGPLHVHHRQPIAEGGSHAISNLRALCERCHEKTHGGRVFTYEDTAEKLGGFAEKLMLINQAIGGDQLVNFRYTRDDGVRSVRCIRPCEIKRVGSAVCVVGFCYLRQTNRTFAISRMRKLEITASPGPCAYLRD